MAWVYGKGSYGGALYSAPQVVSGGVAPIVALTAPLSITKNFAGNLAPAVAFKGSFSTELAGNLKPNVGLSGSASLTEALAGTFAPQVAFSGFLGGPINFQAGMTLSVAFAGSELTSGSQWRQAAPCPPPMWAEDLCPDPGWIPLTAPGNLVYQASDYGLRGYGVNPYGLGTYVPAGPSPWVPAELCHG